MGMQIVTIPLYDKDMSVSAYLFRYKKGNDLFSTTQATGIFDGASRSEVLDTLNTVGLDAFTLGKPIFVPISYIMLLGDIAGQCKVAPDKVVFLIEDTPKPEEPYLSKMADLCQKGFRFAVHNITAPEKYDEVLKLCSFFFLAQDAEKATISARIKTDVKSKYPDLTLVAAWIPTAEAQQALQKSGGYTLYQGSFHSVPVTEGEHEVSPLKANSIRLINTVQDDNFDFDEVAKVVQGDPALTISLLRIVNAPGNGMRNKIKTISQAVAMMGQAEVRKWVTTAVSQSLGDDRPNEITKISLVRAKFAESLAPLYEMAHMSQALFLMGLFSVLDLILEVPMDEALNMVLVSDVIRDALVNKSGMYYPVMQMITDYEAANWSAVSRHMIVHDVKDDKLAAAYLDSLIWYKNLMTLEHDEDDAE